MLNILLFIQIFNLMDPQTSKPAFTPEEIAIIEEELAASGITDNPNQSQLEALHSLLSSDKTLSDLALYIKQRTSVKPKEQQLLKIPLPDNKLSIFKQFAESKIEEDEPQKEYVCKSKRKVKPTQPLERLSLEEAVQAWDSNTMECHSMFEKRGRKGFSGQSLGTLNESCLWNFHEQFYSSLDRNYFREEPLRRLLNEMDFISERMTYYEHRMIRQALPVPKTFGPEFISSQIVKLGDVVSQNRMIPRQKGQQSELNVGKEVIVLHPVCGHLHTGSILAIYKENQLLVKFQRPELGTHKVVDTLMTPREISNHQRVVIQNVDYEVMALAIRLLQYKTDLLRLLKQYNIMAESIQKSQGTLENVFFQEYGWLGSTINILSLGIRQVISKFRFRGLSKENQEKIGKHFASILINPLNLMEKELKKSSQNSDQSARGQINEIIGTYKESRTEQLTKDFYSKVAGKIGQSGLESDQQEEMEKLLKSMIGLLVNLRYECRSFSMEDNKYLNELMNVIDTRYPEHFNEIYETLHSITSKMSEEVK